MKRFILATLLAVVCFATVASAHDTWVQAGSLVTRHQDVTYVDLMLGNHGNNHRDFKLASKISLAPCTLELIAPDGTRSDLKPKLIDMGSAEKEGYWSARITPEQTGLYQVVHTLDTLHGKTRAIKSGKTFFIASKCFGSIPKNGADRLVPIQKGLELTLETPVEAIAAKREIRYRVLWHGKPLPNARVAFVPKGATLAEGHDSQHEKLSDAQGFVAFTPSEGNLLLAVVHHIAADENGEGYDKTHYGATLVLPVPQIPFSE